ncbi:MAG: tRNA epoxyqueuosine(34) reductase QueG [Gemmatimonadota bacterium]
MTRAGGKELARRIREAAATQGLTWVGITGAEPPAHEDAYRRWIAEGMHGTMEYMARADAVERRFHLDRTLAGVRSVVVVADPYDPGGEGNEGVDASRGIVARYARGTDYHRVLLNKLRAILDAIPEVNGTAYVDTGPILERELGQRAGLGWMGKNTLLIHPRRGSYFFLGVLLLDAEVALDPPFEADRCGTCTACIDACPTGALLGRDEEGVAVLDARRCISYLTIELRGPIPEDLRPLMGNRVFGCDICQEVCPWNQRFAARETDEAYVPRPELQGPDLVAWTRRLLEMSGKEYRRVYADSPLSRPGRKGMLRNLCVALGNGPEGAEAGREAVLRDALAEDSPLVRSHAAWALREVGTEDALELLRERAELESDSLVLGELRGAPCRVESSET